MANRSYLYSHHSDAKVPFRDLSEWSAELPLAHLILVGSGATPCRSALRETRRKIAIRGDAAQARPVFLALLDWLEPQLPGDFALAAEPVRRMLLRGDRQGSAFHLEPFETYELIGLSPDEMEEEAFEDANRAATLFEEVRRLVVTEGATLRDSTEPRIRRIADDWGDWLGLHFPGILYFHLGGRTDPKARAVPDPPIPPQDPAAAGHPTRPKRRPRRTDGVGDPDRADWQRAISEDRRPSRRPRIEIPASNRVGWLRLAIGRNHAEGVRQLLESGVDVNAPPEEKDDEVSWLERAAGDGLLEIVKLLVEHGADVDHAGKGGPALVRAIRSGHIAVFDYLEPMSSRRHRAVAARRVAEVSRTRDERERVFRFADACARGLLPTVGRLLKQGVDVNARCEGFRGLTPLAQASQGRDQPDFSKNGHEEIVALLLASGADPNLESYEGRTPLMRVGRAEIGRRLLDAGADAQAVDDEGRNVLAMLADAECCRLLLDAGAKADAIDHLGRGVLWHNAWWAGRRQELGWLGPKNEADADAHLAAIFGRLIAAGATLDPPAEGREGPLDLLAGLQVPRSKLILSAAPVRSPRGRKARPRRPC